MGALSPHPLIYLWINLLIARQSGSSAPIIDPTVVISNINVHQKSQSVQHVGRWKQQDCFSQSCSTLGCSSILTRKHMLGCYQNPSLNHRSTAAIITMLLFVWTGSHLASLLKHRGLLSSSFRACTSVFPAIHFHGDLWQERTLEC